MASTTADTTTLREPRQSVAIRVIDQIAEHVSRRSIVVIATLMTLLIGAGDYATGVETPFTMLYLLPIGLGTWFRSRRFGMLLSVLATGCLAFSLFGEGISWLAITWNVLGSVVLFVAASWVIDQLRSHVERQGALRRLAVDQLRHAERLNVIGTLAAGVAHELGTPLNVIAGCAEFLAEGSSEERVHRRTTMILDQIAKISTIIRHLLDFGHRGAVAPTRVDLNAVAATSCEMLESTARKRGVSIACELGAPVHVTGNAPELEQVLSNLILNAVQAMKSGTVHVKVGSRLRDGKQIACIDVEDQGRGISDQDLPRIFDPFFTTKGLGEGTGLGLSVSYGIVRDHNGSIEVTSKSRVGSKFTVLLPQCE